jgi:AAA ATPase domain
MFVGRLTEVERLESQLIQTRAGHPTHFMLTGERGIGKTSLLNYFKWVAEGKVRIGDVDDDERVKLLVIDVDIDQSTTQLGLIRKIELSISRQLAKSEPGRHFLKEAWTFLQRIEAKGIRIGAAPSEVELDEVVFEEFSYTLKDIADRITSPESDGLFGAVYEGIVLLIDEADNASKALHLGTFLKLLHERLERRGCACLMTGLAGLPELRATLRMDHPSAVRMFEEVPLARLSDSEVNSVIDRCLERAEIDNDLRTSIKTEARDMLVSLSEGYPHFIQQFGYSAFNSDEDDVISAEDVRKGAFGKRGALEHIGDRYYRDDFYNKIQEERYRQVLRIMADKLDGWVTKQEIRERFKGTTANLDNAIKALRDRKIILIKEGERGVYRLQHKGFALWIKLNTADPQDISSPARG